VAWSSPATRRRRSTWWPRARAVGARVLVDAAQSVPHLPVDVGMLNCDFVAFSGHKMCGPTGVGVLYGRPELLEEMPPFLTGGGMISRVGRTETTWADPPWKFEAGTPAIAEAVGLGAAVDYLSAAGMETVWAHEQELAGYALERLAEAPGVHVVGPPVEERCGVVSFTVESIHPHDLAQALDWEGIAIRAGRHCAHPLHDRLGLEATAWTTTRRQVATISIHSTTAWGWRPQRGPVSTSTTPARR